MCILGDWGYLYTVHEIVIKIALKFSLQLNGFNVTAWSTGVSLVIYFSLLLSNRCLIHYFLCDN